MWRSFPGPDRTTFERLARGAIAGMPDKFRVHLAEVVIEVREFASAQVLASLGIESRWDLTGLYEGRPLTERSIWESGEMPPMISLFRQPLLAEMHETGVELEDLVRHVVIHEAGHHFGFSDDDMHWLEDQADR